MSVNPVEMDAKKDAEDFGWNGQKFPPGKMEGNPFYVPYFYHEIILENAGETVGVWECTQITDDERTAFDLGTTEVVGIREDNEGFVRYKLMTMDEYEDLVAEAQFDREHP